MKNKAFEDTTWSLYWAQDRLHSCVAANEDSDQAVLDDIWKIFAESLSKNARVLDLATGNGAVPSALLLAKPSLLIEAVDQADIDPAKFLKNNPELTTVKFHANTDINKLPFKDKSFDAISSQFGIEYAGLSDASKSASKCLKPGGDLCFIIHHTDSSIIESSHAKIIEMQELLKPKGIVDTLLSVLRGDVEFNDLELLGQSYLDGDFVRTQQISGQVFSGIEQIAAAMQTDPQRARNLTATLNLRVCGEFERLRQMANAAQSEDEMNNYQQQLTEEGFTNIDIKQIYADKSDNNYLLAWHVQAESS